MEVVRRSVVADGRSVAPLDGVFVPIAGPARTKLDLVAGQAEHLRARVRGHLRPPRVGWVARVVGVLVEVGGQPVPGWVDARRGWALRGRAVNRCVPRRLARGV